MTSKIEDLKDIIGEIIISEDVPDILVCDGGRHVKVYRNIYYSSLSQSIVDDNNIFRVRKNGYALNEHIVLNLPYRRLNLDNTSYVLVPSKKGDKIIPFIFNVRDVQKHYIEVSRILCDVLPKELVDIIMLYLDCAKPKNEYSTKEFPFKFENEYRGLMPSVISREQLGKLYKLGMIKIAIEIGNNFISLTDESFDYVYPMDNINHVKNKFKTKAKMNNYIKMMLKISM